MELTERIRDYEALLDRKEALDAELKETNKMVEQARAELSAAMIDAEVERIGCNGYNYAVSEKVRYNKRGGVDEELFDVLREDGLGDIIRETVNAQTLQATMRDLAEHNDGELPEQYRDLISEYRYFDVSRRKST